MVAQLAATVATLADELQELRSGSPPAQARNPGPDPDDVDISTLRRMEPLSSRVDAMLAEDTALPQNPASELLNLHMLTGGKLLKSPRDAPIRKIVYSILWPNQMVSRLAGATAGVKYDDLTMCEWVLGTTKILLLPEVSDSEKTGRLNHTETIMALARHYAWQEIRAMYGAVLDDIQYGTLKWTDSIQAYKDTHMIQSALLSNKSHSKSPKFTSALQEQQTCRKYNFELCTRAQCPYRHVCFFCHRFRSETAQHKAKDCPHRQEQGPARPTTTQHAATPQQTSN